MALPVGSHEEVGVLAAAQVPRAERLVVPVEHARGDQHVARSGVVEPLPGAVAWPLEEPPIPCPPRSGGRQHGQDRAGDDRRSARPLHARQLRQPSRLGHLVVVDERDEVNGPRLPDGGVACEGDSPALLDPVAELAR